MAYTTLISAADLAALLAAPPERRPLVCDCSFDLADPESGRRAHLEGHVPGAVYLHLDEDLSGPKTGRNGRHPLPDGDAFAARLAALGAREGMQIIAYDRSGGMMAGRLWWMLRWLGHRDVAVLDGGLPAWVAEGHPLESGAVAARQAGNFAARPSLVPALDQAAVRANLATRARLVVDARAADRFRGENETLDPVGGHIPGAVNRFFKDNLQPDGRFKPADRLADEWRAVLGGRDAAQAVMQCGSGVTACHNLLALEHAGLPGAALYPGSWSEWCAQPDAPVATGPA